MELRSGLFWWVLDDDQFLVHAENAAEDIADFAGGGARLHAVDDGGHGVFGAAGDGLELFKGGLRLVGVAIPADALKAVDLPLRFLGVDAEDLHGRFVAGGE